MSKTRSSQGHNKTPSGTTEPVRIVGFIGWVVLMGSVLTLAACDDTKDLCLKNCAKMEECMLADTKGAKKPAGSWQDAAPEKKAQALAEEIDGTFKEAGEAMIKKCKSDCEGDLSDAKDEYAKLKTCLDKECDAFTKCVSAL